MSHEDWIIGQIDRDRGHNRAELSPLMSSAHERANRDVLKNPDYVIKESGFAPVYTPQAIAADVAYADQLEKKFTHTDTPETARAKKVADTFEGVVLMQSELNEWFGKARTLKTARYDDYVNKVDMIAEWFTPNDGSRLLALAVDVTFGTMSIQHKLDQIKDEIDKGKLGSIKYFRDERGDFMGRRNNVPRTVIGVSESVVEELARLWMKNDNKALATHPVQRLFVDEIHSQLKAMHDYALKRENHDAVLAYTQALAVIQPLRESKIDFFRKKNLPYTSTKITEDRVAEEIRFRAGKLFG